MNDLALDRRPVRTFLQATCFCSIPPTHPHFFPVKAWYKHIYLILILGKVLYRVGFYRKGNGDYIQVSRLFKFQCKITHYQSWRNFIVVSLRTRVHHRPMTNRHIIIMTWIAWQIPPNILARSSNKCYYDIYVHLVRNYSGTSFGQSSPFYRQKLISCTGNAH